MTRYLQYPSHFFTETRRQKQAYKVAVPQTFIATKQGHMRYAKYLSNPPWIQLSDHSHSTYPYRLNPHSSPRHTLSLSAVLRHHLLPRLALPPLAISMHSPSRLHIAF